MEFTVEKQVIRMKEELRTEMQEHPVDSELILPDYCPDIARILKCKGEPWVVSKQLGEGLMTLEGTVTIQLMYVNEEGEICFYRQILPFYHEMKLAEEARFASVVAKMDYCNCRAVNSRKVEIHGAVSMRVRLQADREVTLITNAAGAGVELLRGETQVTTLLGVAEKSLTVTDELQISSGSIRAILRSSGVVRNVECKTVTGKAVMKGDLEVFALYQNMNGGYETLRGQIPFTQLLDMEGVEDDCDCCVGCRVTSLELRTRTGLDGECKNVMVSAGITVEAQALRTVTLPIITDGYSTKCSLGLRRYNGNMKRLCANVREVCLCKRPVEWGREISSVVDLWCEITDQRVRRDEDEISVSGMLCLCMLAKDTDGLPVYMEKAVDYIWQHPLEGIQAADCEARVTAQSFSYTLTGDTSMDVRAELAVELEIYEAVAAGAVCDLTVDPSVAPPPPLAPLVLYYGRVGERVFDIARRYNTTCKAIMTANGLREDTLPEKKALLIPIL